MNKVKINFISWLITVTYGTYVSGCVCDVLRRCSTCVQMYQTGCGGVALCAYFAGTAPSTRLFSASYCTRLYGTCRGDGALWSLCVHTEAWSVSPLSRLTHSCPHKNKLVAWKNKNNINNNLLRLENPPSLGPFIYLKHFYMLHYHFHDVHGSPFRPKILLFRSETLLFCSMSKQWKPLCFLRYMGFRLLTLPTKYTNQTRWVSLSYQSLWAELWDLPDNKKQTDF